MNARLDEDEAAANGLFFACRMSGPLRFVSGYGGPAADAFIARHDPARVLREVAAGRRILARHVRQPGQHPDFCRHDLRVLPCPDMRDLLARWDDHPDYRPEWKP